MSTVTFGKRVDDIEEPILLPEDWYPMEVLKEPEVMINKAKKDDPEAENAGDNWVVSMKTVDCEEEFAGREMAVFLGIPNEKDKYKFTRDGQRIYDKKMQNIVNFAEAFGGTIGEDDATLNAGALGRVYVLQGPNRISGEMENSIDIFNAGYKTYGADDGGGAPETASDGTPF